MAGANKADVFLFVSCLCLFLAVARIAAQCPSATLLPTDVIPNLDPSTVTNQLREQVASLEKTIPARFRALQLDVYSVAVVYRNSTIYSTGMVNTPFRIGSVTKIFSAMGALILRQQGRLQLDDPVKKFLPKFSVIDPYTVHRHDITLRELMGHLSGLPRELCLGGLCGTEDEEAILRLIAKMELVRPPWSRLPSYSNLGFALLGHAWEKATSPRLSWGEFVRREISIPLGMNDTGLDLAHVQLAPGNVLEHPSNTSNGWVGPAADMYSTALDLAKFLKFLLQPDEDMLTEAAVREWIRPTTRFPDASNPASTLSGYALPWELVSQTTSDNQSVTLVTKGGGFGSYYSVIAFHPESQLGVVVLTSTSNTTGSSYPLIITKEILQDLIPAVESIHSKIISSVYSGVYTCERSRKPIENILPNVTLQVLGGSIVVPPVAPGKALLAEINITLASNGEEGPFAITPPLVLKSASEQSFWAYSGTCSSISGALSLYPEVSRPNFPNSADLYEVVFDLRKKTAGMPRLGAVCYK